MTHQQLHLLVHDLADLRRCPWPLRPPIIRKARSSDEPAVLALDAAAFDPTWRLGTDGFDVALRATPLVRHRVATLGSLGRGGVVGYAVSGVAGRRGYLQRLGVYPSARRRGVGTELVADGLRWMRRQGANEAIVNTQVENQGALALYLSLGFTLLPPDHDLYLA